MSPRHTVRDREQGGRRLNFADNALAQQLYGAHHAHLARIEAALDVTIHARGNRLSFTGDGDQTATARGVVEDLYKRLERGLGVDREEVDAALRMAGRDETGLTIRTRRKSISPRSAKQADYIRAMDDFDLVFGLGPAGTGKTYLAVAKAVQGLIGGEVDRIILSRPAVEAGENLGFLPGDLREKVDPYLRPLYDALYDMMPAPQVAKFLEGGEIEVAPLAFMRGRTLANAFIILDEAQNTTAVQMKMLLTRMGENSRMVVTGDLTQVDLPRGTGSGLGDALRVLERVPGVAFVHFSGVDVVRHGLVTRIVSAYDKADGPPDAGKGKKPR